MSSSRCFAIPACFSRTPPPSDSKQVADHWRDVTWKSDAEIARLVRDDRIDILVDLTGHMGRTRLLVFARKPAPVQVTYIGYQNTTGMSAMDYRLTDDRADPPGATDSLYTEKARAAAASLFLLSAVRDAGPHSAAGARARLRHVWLVQQFCQGDAGGD